MHRFTPSVLMETYGRYLRDPDLLDFISDCGVRVYQYEGDHDASFHGQLYSDVFLRAGAAQTFVWERADVPVISIISKESPISPSTLLHEMGHALLILQTYLATGQPYGEPHIWQETCASVKYQEVMSRYRDLYNHDLVTEQSVRAELYAETYMVIEAVGLDITQKDVHAFGLVTDENRTQLRKTMEFLIAVGLEQYRNEVRPNLEKFTLRLRGPGHEIIDVALHGSSTSV